MYELLFRQPISYGGALGARPRSRSPGYWSGWVPRLRCSGDPAPVPPRTSHCFPPRCCDRETRFTFPAAVSCRKRSSSPARRTFSIHTRAVRAASSDGTHVSAGCAGVGQAGVQDAVHALRGELLEDQDGLVVGLGGAVVPSCSRRPVRESCLETFRWRIRARESPATGGASRSGRCRQSWRRRSRSRGSHDRSWSQGATPVTNRPVRRCGHRTRPLGM